MKSKQEIKKFFENGDIPNQEQFWDWQDSYWHKDETIPSDKIDLDLSAKADLVGGKVPASQLPSYMDDVLEFASFATLPTQGESGKIYITIDNEKLYRWTGTRYVDITQGDVGTLQAVTERGNETTENVKIQGIHFGGLASAENIIIGDESSYVNNRASGTIAIGKGTKPEGTDHLVIGNTALANNVSGSIGNTVVGNFAMMQSPSSSENAVFGYNTFSSSTNAFANAVFGTYAGQFSGESLVQNTIFGYNAGNGLGSNSGSNIIIGAQSAFGNAVLKNKLYIHTSSSSSTKTVSDALISGDFVDRYVNINGKFSVTPGQMPSSDGSYTKNIVAKPDGTFGWENKVEYIPLEGAPMNKPVTGDIYVKDSLNYTRLTPGFIYCSDLSDNGTVISTFEFVYKDQLNFGDFKAKLSLDSLKLFVNIFTELESGEMPADGYDFSNITVLSDRKLQLGTAVVEMIDFYDTYVEVFEKLDEELSANIQELFQRSPLQEQKYLNLGNVLVPVSNSRSNLSQIISRTYYLKASYDPTYSRTPASFTFYYQAESNSYGLGSAKVTATTDFGTFDETYSNIEIVDNKVTFPPILVDKFGKLIRSLKIQIFFNNGKQATVEYTDIIIGQPYTGILYTEESTTEDPENPEGGQTPQPGTFVPKHFGVKRLGIADYLKVVQSVHAYVPGEVSNIENVMASELRHKSSVARDYSEITDTTSESIETEKISDTTKAERNEMQTEVAKELEKQQSVEAHTRFTAGGTGWTLEVGGSYANNSAQHDSTRQAVSKSQELTERAMERVLTKINKERVQKVIKEFTETNVHEFDNRGKDGSTPQHITGVYRWVDKKMKNQIYNYGKRTMFEFMIPEPAQLHRLAMAATATETLTAPIDPRTAPSPQTMKDGKTATLDQLQYWASYYNVKLTDLSEATKKFTTGKTWVKLDGSNEYQHITIGIPTNYQASHIKMWYGYEKDVKGIAKIYASNFTGSMPLLLETYSDYNDFTVEYDPQNVTGDYDFVYQGHNIDSINFTFEVTCKLSDTYMNAWKQENFDAIMKAYQDAYAAFLEKQKELEAALKEQEAENQEKVSTFYRDMENVILKHNCIAFLLQDYSALGKNMTNSAKAMQDFSIILDDKLDQYTALAKFMEQAFEWSIMDYTFYPYYWANRTEWQKMYLSNSTDPLFRSFLQAGMARVVVTVNPGFEDAVQFFLTTGRIWNGGEVPVIGDPMYMSIVDELRQPTGEAQGKYWISRIPTTLTILQAESVGLRVTQPLPIFPEDNPENCENPKDLEIESSFFKENLRMEGTGDGITTLPKTIVE